MHILRILRVTKMHYRMLCIPREREDMRDVHFVELKDNEKTN